MKTRDLVEEILRDYPLTRNNDIQLLLTVWWKLRPEAFCKNVNGDFSVTVNAVKELPKESVIQRIRAHIQNDLKMYLPTDQTVVEQRKQKRENWQEVLV